MAQDALHRGRRSYVGGLTFEQFAADPRTVDAASDAIVVIGEAAKAIPETVTSAAPEKRSDLA